jgi:hypothetical protein
MTKVKGLILAVVVAISSAAAWNWIEDTWAPIPTPSASLAAWVGWVAGVFALLNGKALLNALEKADRGNRRAPLDPPVGK